MDRDNFTSEAEEDIRVDISYAARTFNKGLRHHGLKYIEEIQRYALQDYELEGKYVVIEQAFHLLKQYVQRDGRYIDNFSLLDFKEFDLSDYIVNRIAYLVQRHDSDSPPPSQLHQKINKNSGHGTRSSRDSNDSARTARRLERLASRGQSDEYYDDDFEDEIEEEASLEGLGEGSSMEKSGSIAPPKGGGIADRNRYLQEKHADDSEEEIADETIHAPYRHNSNDHPQRYNEDSEEEYSDRYRNGNGRRGDGQYRSSRVAPMEVEMRSPSGRPPNHFSSPTNASRRTTNREIPRPSPRVEESSSSSPSKPRNSVREERGSRDSHYDTGTSDVDASTHDVVANANRSRTSTAASTSDIQRRSRRKAKTQKWITAREWRKGEKIGSGSFGEVYQGMNFQGKLFAVKKMNVIDKPSEVKSLLGEIDLMRGLQHPHIVEYLGAYVDQEEGALYIFQEWVPGGSVAHLLQKFGPFPVGVVRSYTRQILDGLQYLHSNGIVHRDIKGGNILVDDSGQVKVADFGASTKVSQFDQTQETTTIKGTPYFMAPEVLASSKYGRKGDVWAVGCTMIQMLTGQPPWKDRNLKGLVQLHMLLTNWNKGPPPHDQKTTPDCEECLNMCFRKDENNRPSVLELLACKFMQEDELDESGGNSSSLERQFTRQFTGLNNTGGSDMMEDSGIMRGLQQDISAAVSKSQAGALSSRNDDTIAMIENRMPPAQQEVRRNSRAAPDNPFASPQSDKQITPRSQMSSQQERQRRGSRAAPDNPFGSQHSGDTPRTAAVAAAAALYGPAVAERPTSNRQQQQQQMLEIAEQQVKWAQEQNVGGKYSARGSRGSQSSRGSHGAHVNGSPPAQYSSITSKTPPAEGAQRRQSFDVDPNRIKRNSFSNPVTPIDKNGDVPFAPGLPEEPHRMIPPGNDRSPRSILNSPQNAVQQNGVGSSGSSSNNPFGRGAAGGIRKFSPRTQPDDFSPLTPNESDNVSRNSGAARQQPPEAIRESLTSLKAKRTGSRAGSRMGSRHNSASSIDANINQSTNRDSEDVTPYADDNSDNEYYGVKDGVVSYDCADYEIQRTRSDGTGRTGYVHKPRGGVDRLDSLEAIQEESHYAAVHPTAQVSAGSSRNTSRDGSEASDRGGAVADIHSPKRSIKDSRHRNVRSQELLEAPDDVEYMGSGNHPHRKHNSGMRKSASETNTEYVHHQHTRPHNSAERRLLQNSSSNSTSNHQIGAGYGRHVRNPHSNSSVSASGGAAVLRREYPTKSESARAHRTPISQDMRKSRPNTSTAALAGGQAVVMSPKKNNASRTNSNLSEVSAASGTSRKPSFKDYGDFRAESLDDYGNGEDIIEEVYDEEEEEDENWMCLNCGAEGEPDSNYCGQCAYYRGNAGRKGTGSAINYRG